MKTLKLCLSLLTGLLMMGFAKAQTVDEIINRHIDAIGGKDKISQVKTIVIQNVLQVVGTENIATTTIVDGVGYKSESEFQGQKIVQCYTDKGGWISNPILGGSGVQPLAAEEYKSIKGQIYIGGPLVDYAAKGYKAELLSKEGNTFRIKLISSENVESIYFIDGTTYFVTRMTHKGVEQGQDIEITSTFSDYRKTDFGYVIPFKTDFDFGQFQVSSVVKQVDINKEIDPVIFDMPK